MSPEVPGTFKSVSSYNSVLKKLIYSLSIFVLILRVVLLRYILELFNDISPVLVTRDCSSGYDLEAQTGSTALTRAEV